MNRNYAIKDKDREVLSFNGLLTKNVGLVRMADNQYTSIIWLTQGKYTIVDNEDWEHEGRSNAVLDIEWSLLKTDYEDRAKAALTELLILDEGCLESALFGMLKEVSAQRGEPYERYMFACMKLESPDTYNEYKGQLKAAIQAYIQTAIKGEK